MTNGKRLLELAIALAAASTFQLARADLTQVCAGSGEDPNHDGATVCYDTSNGIETGFTFARGPGSYSISPDGNPGHESISETATAPNRSARATADLGLALQKAFAFSSDSPASAAGATCRMEDTVTFHNSSSQAIAITIHYHLNGMLTVGPESRSNYTGRFTFDSLFGGSRGGTIDFSGQRCLQDGCQNFDNQSVLNWDQNGASVEVIPVQAPASGFDLTGHMLLPPGDFAVDVFLLLQATAAPAGVSGSATSDFGNTASLTFDLPPEVSFNSVSGTLSAGSRLVNISTRAEVLGGDSVAIAGFIVTGNDPKKVIIRGIGPSLAGQGVSGALADPTLELHHTDAMGNDVTLATNNDWKDTQQSEIEATGIPPTNDLESAIVRTLDPGSYTAILRGKNNGTGVGLVEVYDLAASVDSRLANISTRAFVDTGDNVLIGGIIGGGNGSQPKVLIRAIGPSLTGAGVANALQDPFLELHDANGGLVASNNDWQDTQKAEIEATGIPPTDARESAIVATLLPTNYTAIVRGQNNTSGVGLVEVYQLQ
jgi:hypothetical protein